jgi:hypothetical protein
MKIVYIISAYKYPEQLIRLILRLNTKNSQFFVHIDKKTSAEIYNKIFARLSSFPNVLFLERHKCYWGDFGHVSATIKGIKEIYNKKVDFDYVILLTGQDYPIKSNNQIESFLNGTEKKSFIKYFQLPCEYWYKGGFDRIERWHFRLFNKPLAFPNKHLEFPVKRQFPKGFKPFGGFSYWCLSRECVEYIHDFINQNREFINFFKYVLIPDEMFFQTILLNSPLKGNIINDDLRYIKWIPRTPNPLILGKNDFEEMMKSSKLFARKFDLTQDADVLDMIDQNILS